MAPDEYTKALDKSLLDLAQRIQQRDILIAEIAGLKETVRVLSSRVTLTADKQKDVAQMLAMADSVTPSLTDAVRALLTRVYPKDMTAVEVRDALENSSSTEDIANSLSACHAALKRMLQEGELELGPAPRNGKTTYRRVFKMIPPGMVNSLTALLIGSDPKTIPGSSTVDEARERFKTAQRLKDINDAMKHLKEQK